MTRRARHRRVYAHRTRRYHIGPSSWLDRLQRAAYGGHVCRPYIVLINPKEHDHA